MSHQFTLTADGQTSSVRFPSKTVIQMDATGTFGGGTLTPQKKGAGGAWTAISSSTLTAAGQINLEVPAGTDIRASLASATDPDIDIHFIKIS
jgi:hypothetical protein